MTSAIWKYELAPRVTLDIPQGGKVLCVEAQNNKPQMWVLVNPHEWKVSRTFRVYPTGVEFNVAGLTYVGTFQINGGALVFHAFEETP